MSDVAVVTGGASGFGLALGAQLAQRGLRVALLDRDADRVRDEAAALGGDVLGLAADVSDPAAVEAAAAAVVDRWGQVDLVVSNVGVQLFGPVDDLTDAEWSWVLDLNVVGSARVARAFLPHVRRSARGRLAFTTSSSVLDPASRMAAYQASKFAVWGLAETLRLELAGDDISVTVVFPSGMVSRHLETSAAAQPEALRRPIGTEADMLAMVASNPAMVQAVATAEEAAGNVVEAVLAGAPYAITHGDLAGAIEARSAALLEAARSGSPSL